MQLLKVNHSTPPFLSALTLGLSSTALCVRVTLIPRTGWLETILLVFFFIRSLIEMTAVDSTIPLWLNWDLQKVIVIPQPSASLLSPVWVAPWCAVTLYVQVPGIARERTVGERRLEVIGECCMKDVLMCVVRPQQLTPTFLHNSATFLSMTAILVWKQLVWNYTCTAVVLSSHITIPSSR